MKNEGSCRGGEVPSFIGVCSKYGSREKGGSFRGGRGTFFHSSEKKHISPLFVAL